MAASKCPKCDRAAGKTARFCKECGYRLVPEDPTEDPKEKSAKSEAPAPLAEKPLEAAIDEALTEVEEITDSTPESAVADVPCAEDRIETPDTTAPMLPMINTLSSRFSVEVVNGAEAGRVFEVNSEPAMVGSEDTCAICISNDERISRRHAAFWVEDGHLIVRDEGSTNGTMIAVVGTRPLIDGDTLVMGATVLRVTRVEND